MVECTAFEMGHSAHFDFFLFFAFSTATEYWLGKRRDQEEVYCTFGPKDVNEAGKDTTVSKHKIEDLARQLEDFSEIRFIVLTRLPPPQPGQKRHKGKWLGLTPKEDVVRGYDALSAGASRQLPPPPHHEEANEWKRTLDQNAHLPFKKRKVYKMMAPYRRKSPNTVFDTASISASSSFENHENVV